MLPSDRELAGATTTVPAGAPDEAAPPVDAPVVEVPGGETETVELTHGQVTTTLGRLQMEPAGSERAWSALPVIVGVLLMGAILLLVLGLRRKPVPHSPWDG